MQEGCRHAAGARCAAAVGGRVGHRVEHCRRIDYDHDNDDDDDDDDDDCHDSTDSDSNGDIDNICRRFVGSGD